MLSNLYMKTAWSRYHMKRQRIYLIMEPTRVIKEGGRYVSPNGITVHEIRAVHIENNVFSNEMDAQSDGLTYSGKEKFVIPMSEFVRLGITMVQDRQPNMVLAMESAGIYRVKDIAPDNYRQIWKFACEELRESFPNFSSAWDMAGEAPSGWVANDPADAVVFDGQLTIINTVAESNPSIYVNIQDHIHAPAIKFSCEFKCTAIPDSVSPAAFILLGDAPTISANGVLVKIEIVEGVLKAGVGSEFVDIENGEWHTLEYEDDEVVIDDNDPIPASISTNGLYLMFSGYRLADPVVGAAATTLFKNVEVSCLDAI